MPDKAAFPEGEAADKLVIVCSDYETGGQSPIYAWRDLSSTSGTNIFSIGVPQLKVLGQINMSILVVAEKLSKKQHRKCSTRPWPRRFAGWKALLSKHMEYEASHDKQHKGSARPFALDTQEFHLTASIGISTYPADSEDLQSLLKNADVAMYRAKELGKNNFQFYSAQMNIHTLERLALESSLRGALERNEFVLHYQPKVDIRSGRIIGMEALVRWQHPTKGLIPPMQFIPLAEETGLIVPIGEWVLRTACARNKSWQEQGLPPLCIAVNLSARQFTYENLLKDVARVLNETGLDAAFLELEITESMVMHDPEHAIELLNKLKTMGISISIDDFGTGYSSLSYLKRFPIDSVKIDRSFIKDLPLDGDDAAITQAIIAMAHGLKLKVIAEGAETGEQLSFLRAHECDVMQGYYFSKPLPEHEFFLLCRTASRPARCVRRANSITGPLPPLDPAA